MSKFSRALAITLLAASVPATIVVAQQVDDKDQPKAERSEGLDKFSPETRAALEDGRIAMAKVALKMTPEQEKLWAPVEEKIRARSAERSKRAEEWRSEREERRAVVPGHEAFHQDQSRPVATGTLQSRLLRW